ncbi:hypothetical protein MMYC01_202759, partial [Madurella mycetomatis]
MDFKMDIDNPRKRCRGELVLDDLDERAHPTKKTRHSDMPTSARDLSPSLFTPTNESTPSTPASMAECEWRPQASEPQPRSQCTIISGFNQSLRHEHLVQGYPR